MSRTRLALGIVALMAVVAATIWALWPEPQPVDLGQVERAPMQITLTAEGVTRVRDPITITAPITGTTTRSPVQTGDSVHAGETLLAVLQAADPALMDARSRAQAEAAVAEAEAAVQLAEANLERAESALEHALSQHERGERLAASGTISQRMLEDLQQAVTSARQGLSAARAERDLSQATLLRARAQLLGPETTRMPNGEPGDCCVRIIAPVSGTVLNVTDRNARQVSAGTPLVTIGDLADLEVELDLLSSDAVRVPAGAPALITRWGGEGVLNARLRRIEPAAFTRVSALGIEEQRVRLQLDLLTPPEDRAGLGDQFRVLAQIIIWQDDAVLQLPQSALFRHGEGWAVFRMQEGEAHLTPVTPGRRSDDAVEILDGIEAGAQVVLFPPASLSDGARITPRDG